MSASVETTSFRGDDDPRLVEGALACRVCLSGDVEWELAGEQWETQVDCECRECGHQTTLALSIDQALRLRLDRARAVGA